MASIPHRRPPATGLLAVLHLLPVLAVLCLLLPGCDNPACVFGGECSSTAAGGAALGTNPAAIPPDHSWILTGAPQVTRFFPSGTQINTETPIVVVFSETMATQSLLTSVALFSTAGFGAPVPTFPPALVGDGRLLIVVPIGPLDPDGTYELRYLDQSVVTDITGTTLTQEPDRVVGSFTVAATDTNAPRLLATWPEEAASNQSATGEVIVVFDREVITNTVNTQSFALTVDNQTPNPNPQAFPVLLIGAGAFPTQDSRVWRMRKADGQGNALSLGAGGAVHLELSPASNQIQAISGGTLANTGLDYDIANFSAPLSAELVSMPTDAIGIDNLNGDLSNDLDLAATLENAQGSDRIGIFLFGQAPNTGTLITLFREVAVSSLTFDPITQVATLTESELDIASGSNPVQARFADGQFSIALRTQRGNNVSPVRLVDVDMDLPGPQSALLDTTRPTFTAFGSTGNEQQEFVSDVRNLAVIGRASEQLRSVEVVGGGMNNSLLPLVVGANSAGLFVAAPVNLGLVDPALQPIAITVDLYDRALNQATATVSANFIQRGAVGPGNALPANGNLDIEVFDQRTLAPLSGATVFVHNDNGGAVTFVATGTTTQTGMLNLTAGANLTVVTVEAPGYDIVTYHGVPVSRISVPLHRNTQSPGSVLGTAGSANATVTGLTLHVDDSRQFEFDPPVVGGSWSLNAPILTYEAGYGPTNIRLGPPRVVSAVGVVVPANNFSYSASSFLRGYSFELPFPGPSPGGTTTVDFSLDRLLDDANLPLEEQVLDGPQTALSIVGLVGVDAMDLDGEPRITVEARVRGMHGSALAGSGAALDPVGSPATQWTVRSAFPGVADPTSGKYAGDLVGELVSDGRIDPDLFLRIEVRDNSGNRVGRRPRFPAPGVPGNVVPLDVARVTAPIAGGNTGGGGFNLLFEDRISSGGGGQPGLYRATLVDLGGRSWTLYRAAGGGASRRIAVPDLPLSGGVGLVDGPLACFVEAWAWTGFDEAAFLFSDIEREYDRFSAGAPITFTKP